MALNMQQYDSPLDCDTPRFTGWISQDCFRTRFVCVCSEQDLCVCSEHFISDVFWDDKGNFPLQFQTKCSKKYENNNNNGNL